VLCENQYLTGEDVERQKSSGQILHRYTGSLGIDPDRQIRKALKAFEKGEVLLVVSGRTIEDLGQELVINPRTRVTFLKSSHKPRNRSRK
jgi:predicted SpoU family rRNA methylase